MRAIVETAFDVVYLISVVTIGIFMILKCNGNRQYRLFGIMAVVLGAGDAFHLVPRMIALCTTGLDNYTKALGIGKFITSITMTAFYVLLYYVWRLRYGITGKKNATYGVYVLAAARVVFCLLPQNEWLSADPPLFYGILRNIPFAGLGVAIIGLFLMSARKAGDREFRFMWLTIVLSFAFYIPVVLFAAKVPLIGMLMIPKTCAYVWTVLIGLFAMLRHNKASGTEPQAASEVTTTDQTPDENEPKD